MPANKELTAFRFTKRTKNRLSRFAKRKKVPMTRVLEELVGRYCKTKREESGE